MIIDYREVRKQDGLLVKHEELAVSDIVSTHSQVEAISPADVEAQAQLMEALCTVKGKVSYSVTYQCARCLESFEAREKTSLLEEFTGDARQATDEVHLAQDGIVDLAPFVKQSIHLHLEVFPVCKSDCQGLCPVCGINRNDETCNCDVRTIDPRLAALSDLLSEDQSE